LPGLSAGAIWVYAAKRKRDSAQHKMKTRKRDSAQHKMKTRKRDSAQQKMKKKAICRKIKKVVDVLEKLQMF